MAKLRKVFEMKAIWKEKMWVGDEKVEAFKGISLKYESIFMIIKRKSKPENDLQLGFLLFYHRMFVLIS